MAPDAAGHGCWVGATASAHYKECTRVVARCNPVADDNAAREARPPEIRIACIVQAGYLVSLFAGPGCPYPGAPLVRIVQ